MFNPSERSAFLLGLGVGLAGFGVASRLPVGDAALWGLLFVGVALAWVGAFTRSTARGGAGGPPDRSDPA